MTKEIRPLQRYNKNTEQTEIFYPGTTTDAVAHPTKRKSLTNVISDIEEAYAKQTGYYETLGAGTATNLRGVNPTEGTFTFRPSGGSADVATGTAYLERIKGNTVKWNQLLRANKLVDMGLPSGTLWATCDIDVTKADKFCETPFTYDKSFFSWGNIDGHNPISNKAFGYDFGGINSEEPWYEGQVYGETQGNTLTSNIPQSATYDAARSHLGASWRMPTSAEFVELLNNTKFINADGTEVDASVTGKRVTVNGVLGIYLESTINGARLFFSCSGLGNGRSWEIRGANGYYWSSTFNSARRARFLGFSSGGIGPQYIDARYFGFALRPVTNSAIVTDENDHKYAVSARYIIDLTLMYGEGNEPSTVAQFEADYFKWFGKPLTSEGFTEGELRDVKMSGIKTVGFNQWDEEWEEGILNDTTGEPRPYSNRWRVKNYIKVFGGLDYYIKNGGSGSLYIFKYDANKTFLGYDPVVISEIYTIPNNVSFIKFYPSATYGATYNNDIAIHLVHSGKRNGEYEPHWEETKDVPITTLTGKLNGEGESIIVFPDGMKSAGEVHDDILIENGGTNGIKRIGSNDLGDYNYTKQGNLYTTDFVPANANMISGRGKAVLWNQLVTLFDNTKWIINPRLASVSDGVLTLNAENINYPIVRQNFNGAPVPIIGHKYLIKIEAKGTTSGGISVGIGDTNSSPTSATVFFKTSPTDWTVFSAISQITSTATWSATIQGRSTGMTVNMQFRNFVIFDLTQMFGAGNEPATVEEFEKMFPEDYYVYDTGSLGIVADATYPDAASFKAAMDGVSLYYELATPLVYELDNLQLPLPYRVDDYGTEEIKGAEKSVAPTLNIRYGINAGDTITNLPKNYISAESIDQLLATMSSAMGGTWTKTWDAANGRYTFSFTQAATLNLAPTEPEPEEES